MQRKGRQRTIAELTTKTTLTLFASLILIVPLSGIINDLGYIDYITWNGKKNAFGLFLILCPFIFLLLNIKEIQHGIYSLTTKLR